MANPVEVNQNVISIISEGQSSSVAEAVTKATNQLAVSVSKFDKPVFVSVSHGVGHNEYTGYYASILAVINYSTPTA